MPFIEEILNNTTQIICDLQPHQHHTFYEAVGLMIQSQQDAIIQESLIKRYMALPNQGFKAIIDGEFLKINYCIINAVSSHYLIAKKLKTKKARVYTLFYPFSKKIPCYNCIY